MTAERIGEVLAGYFRETLPEWEAGLARRPNLLPQLVMYLDVLLRWNTRTNLSAVREPEQIVTRHFGESLFAAMRVGSVGSLLDLGSGAGFPGLPMQLWWEGSAVTLAESQGKKAAFLREVVRTLGLQTEIWARRVEAMEAGRLFDAVILRAVDEPGRALDQALRRTRDVVWVIGGDGMARDVGEDVAVCRRERMPGLERSWLFRMERSFHVEQVGE